MRLRAIHNRIYELAMLSYPGERTDIAKNIVRNSLLRVSVPLIRIVMRGEGFLND